MQFVTIEVLAKMQAINRKFYEEIPRMMTKQKMFCPTSGFDFGKFLNPVDPRQFLHISAKQSDFRFLL